MKLASLADPALLPQAVTSALGIREQPGRPLAETLTDSLGSSRLLLVLDNCEHLVGACARLAEALLQDCPDLRILATNREALGIGGEANWPVPSLTVPEADDLPSVEDLTRYEAVSLLVEQARLQLPRFELTPENAEAVREICRRLEGMPLAIELAVGRVKVLTVEQIAERLKDSLGLVSAGSGI